MFQTGARVDSAPSSCSIYVGEYSEGSVALILLATELSTKLEPHDWHFDRKPAEVHTWSDPQYNRRYTIGYRSFSSLSSLLTPLGYISELGFLA